VVTDQSGSPTLADDLAGAVVDLWRKGATGIYHVAGSEPISRLGFAQKVCEVFDLDRELVLPVLTGELRQRAQRPENSSLNVFKIEHELGRKMLDVRGGLQKMKVQWNSLPSGERAPSSRTA
jgi:dTDP-4-dehydrorhamnose reductase